MELAMNSNTARQAYLFAALMLLFSFKSVAQDVYVSAMIDDANKIHIFTADSQEIVLEMDAEQAGFDDIKISADGTYVGWLALYPNCCTSYPIPLKLNIYSGDRKFILDGIGLPIWKWVFSESDKQVTLYQEATHGGSGTHYETRDLVTNELIQQWRPEYGRDNRPLETQNIPEWVEKFNSLPD
jgi:hypothetical protein